MIFFLFIIVFLIFWAVNMNNNSASSKKSNLQQFVEDMQFVGEMQLREDIKRIYEEEVKCDKEKYKNDFTVFTEGSSEYEAEQKAVMLLGKPRNKILGMAYKNYDGKYIGEYVPIHLNSYNPSRNKEAPLYKHLGENVYAELDVINIVTEKDANSKELTTQLENLRNQYNGKRFLLPIIVYIKNNLVDFMQVVRIDNSGKKVFCLDFENGTCITETNVIGFTMYAKISREKLSPVNFRNFMTAVRFEDLEKGIFAIFKLREARINDAYIYYGDKLIDIFYDVDRTQFDIIEPGKYIFVNNNETETERENRIYSIYSYNKGTVTQLYRGKNLGIWGAKEECRKKIVSSTPKYEQNKICVYFFMNYSKKAIALLQFLKKNYYVEKINNEIEKDSTENYKALVDKEDWESLCFIRDCLIGSNYEENKDIGGYGIMGFTKDYYEITVENKEYPILSELYFVTNEEVQKRKERLRELYEECNEIYSEDSLPICLQKYPSHRNMYETLDAHIAEYSNNQKINYKTTRAMVSEYYCMAVDEGCVSAKWKSEYKLFKAVKELYQDAIYQYNDKWLGLQSLDIFIPSLNLGIEYQGIQHYKSVDFFGGEEAFEKRKFLDEQKRKKCYDRNIKLLEWKYDVPISKVNIRKKIEEIEKQSI